jgi:hypothetical protein
MVVSTGTNPIVNVAGQLTSAVWVAVLSAPATQDIVVTDLVFSANDSGAGEPQLRLASSHDTVGRYFIFGGSYHGGGASHFSLQTGIRIPAGDSLELNINTTNQVNYSLAGTTPSPNRAGTGYRLHMPSMGEGQLICGPIMVATGGPVPS